MNCEAFEPIIALYLEGDLDQSEARPLERHLLDCGRCREFAEGLRASQAALRSLGDESLSMESLDAVRTRVLNDIAAGRAAAGELRVRTPWRWAMAATLAGLLIAVAGARLRHHPSAPPAATQVATIGSPSLAGSARTATSPQGGRLLAARRRPMHNERVAAAHQNQKRQPLVVKLVTNDPNVVIYWLVD